MVRDSQGRKWDFLARGKGPGEGEGAKWTRENN